MFPVPELLEMFKGCVESFMCGNGIRGVCEECAVMLPLSALENILVLPFIVFLNLKSVVPINPLKISVYERLIYLLNSFLWHTSFYLNTSLNFLSHHFPYFRLHRWFHDCQDQTSLSVRNQQCRDSFCIKAGRQSYAFLIRFFNFLTTSKIIHRRQYITATCKTTYPSLWDAWHCDHELGTRSF